jgi:hypothetical protein
MHKNKDVILKVKKKAQTAEPNRKITKHLLPGCQRLTFAPKKR